MSGKTKYVLIFILCAAMVLIVLYLIIRPFDTETPLVTSPTVTHGTPMPETPPVASSAQIPETPMPETPPPSETSQPTEPPVTDTPPPEIVIDKEQISRFFDMNKGEIIQLLGDNYAVVDTGAEGLCDGYAYQDLGLTFVFNDDTSAVSWIEPFFNDADFNDEGYWVHDVAPLLFEIYGLTMDMNFDRIEEKIGSGVKSESFIEIPEYKTFVLSYRMNNYRLEFISFSEDGAYPRLTLFAEYDDRDTVVTPDTTGILSVDTYKFSGVEGDFSYLDYYSSSRLPFGNYSVSIVNKKPSIIEFSKESLKIDTIQIKLTLDSLDYTSAVLLIIDLDVSDEYFEILLCGYGINDWITNTIYFYDGNSVKEVAHFYGWVFTDSYGKLIITNSVGGDLPGRIAYPFITRSYYEYRNGRLKENAVSIKGKTFTFSGDDIPFHFYETPDAPTPEFANKVISSTYGINGSYDARDFAGLRFTILDHSEREIWYRGAWYYVEIEDGRKGIIHWWYAM